MFIILNNKVQGVGLEHITRIANNLFKVNVKPEKMDGNYITFTLGTDIFVTAAEAREKLNSELL